MTASTSFRDTTETSGSEGGSRVSVHQELLRRISNTAAVIRRRGGAAYRITVGYQERQTVRADGPTPEKGLSPNRVTVIRLQGTTRKVDIPSAQVRRAEGMTEQKHTGLYRTKNWGYAQCPRGKPSPPRLDNTSSHKAAPCRKRSPGSASAAAGCQTARRATPR